MNTTAETRESKQPMRINSSRAEILIGDRRIRRYENDLEDLRQSSGQSSDVLTSIPWFLAHTARWNTFPVIVRTRDEAAGDGAVLLYGRKLYGVPTGVLKGGTLCGRGVVIGAEAERPAIVEAAAQRLLHASVAHTIVATLRRPGRYDAAQGTASDGPHGPWRMRETRNCLSLVDGIDGVVSRFSAKMRRNFRYYRQRAERDAGCVFIPQLSPEQSQQAIAALHGHGAYANPVAHAFHHWTTLQTVLGSFAAGLVDGAGKWLSFLAGWRRPEASYIEWQLNSDESGAASISTVMRNYWLQHEISLGVPKVVFVGETTPAWGRTCEPEICGDLLAVREGMSGLAIRQIGHRLRPTGRVARLYSERGTSFYAALPAH